MFPTKKKLPTYLWAYKGACTARIWTRRCLRPLQRTEAGRLVNRADAEENEFREPPVNSFTLELRSSDKSVHRTNRSENLLLSEPVSHSDSSCGIYLLKTALPPMLPVPRSSPPTPSIPLPTSAPSPPAAMPTTTHPQTPSSNTRSASPGSSPPQSPPPASPRAFCRDTAASDPVCPVHRRGGRPSEHRHWQEDERNQFD